MDLVMLSMSVIVWCYCHSNAVLLFKWLITDLYFLFSLSIASHLIFPSRKVQVISNTRDYTRNAGVMTEWLVAVLSGTSNEKSHRSMNSASIYHIQYALSQDSQIPPQKHWWHHGREEEGSSQFVFLSIEKHATISTQLFHFCRYVHGEYLPYFPY